MRLAAQIASLLTGLLLIAVAQAAAAADWVPSAVSTEGIRYETELTTISLNGSVARSWMRETPIRPGRDPKTGAAYASVTQERFDDCQNHRYMAGSYVLNDANGKAVGGGPGDLAAGWVEIVPGTIAESVSRVVCAVAIPPGKPPIEPDLRKGSWTDLGASQDGKFHLQVRIDGIVKLDGGPVIATWRSLYGAPEWVEGLPVRIVVSAAAIDCAAGKSAGLGADFYISPDVRVKATRTPTKDLVFTAPGPKSFLASSIKLICASAIPEKPSGGDEPHEGGLSVGTAWGVNKGYLVTASHVVEGGRKIEVYDNGEKVGDARVVANDPANDLAILKFRPSKPGKIHILPLAVSAPPLGRNVFVLGYPAPDALGQHIKMTAGQVSSTAGFQDDARYLQISVPLQEGNSGGPVITWDGTVVGVVEAKLLRFNDEKESPKPEMVNYALKATYLRPMLEELPDLANYTVVKSAAGGDQMVAAARKAVFMLVVTP